jgi:hypothetical protein
MKDNLAPAEDELLTTVQAARVLDVTPGTLEVWRTTKRYPLPYVKDRPQRQIPALRHRVIYRISYGARLNGHRTCWTPRSQPRR